MSLIRPRNTGTKLANGLLKSQITVGGVKRAIYQRRNETEADFWSRVAATKEGDEKRMPVILRLEDQPAWLHGSPAEALAFIRPFPAEGLHAEPDPAAWKPLAEPKSWAQSDDLFADDWHQAASDPKARALKARRTRAAAPPPKPAPPAEGGDTGDLFG